MTDLIKVLYQYQLTEVSNYAVVTQNNIPGLRNHALRFIGIKRSNVCNLLSNGPGKKPLISKKKS